MKKIGLTLGGGGSRCFAHLGMFQELNDAGIDVDCIVASSTGSLVGTLLANKVPIRKIKEEFYRLGTRFKWFIPNGFLTFSRRAEHDILKALLSVDKLEDSAIPVMLVGTNLNTGEEFIFDQGEIVKAVCASSAHPSVHKPVQFGQCQIADGGILNCIPADVCRKIVGEEGIVLSCALDGYLDADISGFSKWDFLFRSIYIPMLRDRHEMAVRHSNILLEPLRGIKFDFHNWRNILNFHSIELMEHFFELGRQEAKAKIPQIRLLLSR